jgi:hypothetical protein
MLTPEHLNTYSIKFVFKSVIAFANEDERIMAKTISGKVVFPQLPNGDFSMVVRYNNNVIYLKETLP